MGGPHICLLIGTHNRFSYLDPLTDLIIRVRVFEIISELFFLKSNRNLERSHNGWSLFGVRYGNPT